MTTDTRVLKVIWTSDNDDSFCWFQGCGWCQKDMAEGAEGFVWGRPLGEGMVSLVALCSLACCQATIDDHLKEKP